MDIPLGSGGGTSVGYREPVATDDCGQVTLQSRSHVPGEIFPVGRTTVFYVFVDGFGNSVTCSFNVLITEG